MSTANHYAQDSTTEVVEIRKLVKAMKFQVEFQLQRGHREL